MAITNSEAATEVGYIIGKFLEDSFDSVEVVLGQGTARENPDLIAALVSASAIAYNTVAMTQGIKKIEESK